MYPLFNQGSHIETVDSVQSESWLRKAALCQKRKENHARQCTIKYIHNLEHVL